MPLICYTEKRFNAEHQALIDTANEIIVEYREQGFDLTLRQLYYQFVARDVIPNNDRSYKRLGGIISDARRAGLIDWEAIVDRTRNLRAPSSWDSPGAIIAACAEQFDVDFWADQPIYCEWWVEKDALIGVLEVACQPWRTPFFSCRGYTSDSEVWAAGRRLAAQAKAGKIVRVFHLGDHDPSGIDMTRDIADRIALFAGRYSRGVTVTRVALNRDQIDEFNPPPNPAKMTDSRFANYLRDHGDESWELDALDPATIARLVEKHVKDCIEPKAWAECGRRRDAGRLTLKRVAKEIED